MLRSWTGRSADELRERIENSPRTIDQTWKRLLQDVDTSTEGNSDTVRNVLKWLSCATRPLTVDEVREAIAIQKYCAHNTLPSRFVDAEDLIEKCGPLVQYRSSSRVLSLVHFSLKEYLCSGKLAKDPNPEVQEWNISPQDANAELACAALTYLSSEQLMQPFKSRSELDERLQNNKFLSYAAVNGGLHLALLSNEESHRTAFDNVLLGLMRDIFVSPVTWRDLGSPHERNNSAHDVTMTVQLPQDEEHLPYQLRQMALAPPPGCSQEQLKDLQPVVQAVLLRLQKNVAEKPASISWLQTFRILSWVTRKDHNLLITPLYYASFFGWTNGVRKLLTECGSLVVKSDLHHALRAAATGGHTEVIRMLHDAGARLDAKFHGLGSPLQSAAYSGAGVAVIRQLFALGASANERQGFRRPGGQVGCALQGAASFGDKDVVRVLLEHGASINSNTGWLGTPVQAILEDHMADMALFLINSDGFDPNVTGGYYGSAARLECLKGESDYRTFIALIERGLHPDQRVGPYGSLLELCCHFGNYEKCELILRHLTNIDTSIGQFGHAIHAAAMRGDKRIMDMLLPRWTDVNLPASWLGEQYGSVSGTAPAALGKSLMLLQGTGYLAYDHSGHLRSFYAPALRNAYRMREDVPHNKAHALFENEPMHRNGHLGTPLQGAAFRGYVPTLKQLVEAGANLDTDSGFFGTALQAAVSQRHRDATEFLLQSGANLNLVSGGHYGTALAAAIYHDFQDIYNMLVKAGADFNTIDEHGWSAHTWLKLCERVSLDSGSRSERADSSKKPSGWDTSRSSPLLHVKEGGFGIDIRHDAFPPGHINHDGCRCELPMAATAIANHPVAPYQDFYFEVEVSTKVDNPIVCIGVTEKDIPTFYLLGHSKPYWGYRGDDGCFVEVPDAGKPWPNGSSWGYHGDDGFCFAEARKQDFGWPKVSNQDVIGCGIEWKKDRLFFTKNGQRLGKSSSKPSVTFTDASSGGDICISRKRLYPAISIQTNNVSIQANFGSRPFKYAFNASNLSKADT